MYYMVICIVDIITVSVFMARFALKVNCLGLDLVDRCVFYICLEKYDLAE